MKFFLRHIILPVFCSGICFSGAEGATLLIPEPVAGDTSKTSLHAGFVAKTGYSTLKRDSAGQTGKGIRTSGDISLRVGFAGKRTEAALLLGYGRANVTADIHTEGNKLGVHAVPYTRAALAVQICHNTFVFKNSAIGFSAGTGIEQTWLQPNIVYWREYFPPRHYMNIEASVFYGRQILKGILGRFFSGIDYNAAYDSPHYIFGVQVYVLTKPCRRLSGN